MWVDDPKAHAQVRARLTAHHYFCVACEVTEEASAERRRGSKIVEHGLHTVAHRVDDDS